MAKEQDPPEETAEEKKLREELAAAVKDVEPSKEALAKIRGKTGDSQRGNGKRNKK